MSKGAGTAYAVVASNYRALHGKLFAALVKQFGAGFVGEIEDALQNAFLKSLRAWQPGRGAAQLENWLFIVARNDVINQLKRKQGGSPVALAEEQTEAGAARQDLRLQTMLFLAAAQKVSVPAKVVFILKNIFGLNVREISETTLLSQDAIYKSLNRAKKALRLEFDGKPLAIVMEEAEEREVALVEDILYAVFNIGFDTFDERSRSIVNEDLCLEALALARLLFRAYAFSSTKNLLALFCFHLTRLPAKVEDKQLVPFFKQDRQRWDQNLFSLGFYYLEPPKTLHRFYLESLIVSKHMTASAYDAAHWASIVALYRLLLQHHPSPLIALNLCFGLHKAQRTGEALALLAQIEKELPSGHVYLSIIKATLLQAGHPREAEQILAAVAGRLRQAMRKTHLLQSGWFAFE